MVGSRWDVRNLSSIPCFQENHNVPCTKDPILLGIMSHRSIISSPKKHEHSLLHGPQSTPKHSLNGGVLCIATAGTVTVGLWNKKSFAIAIERWSFFHLLRNTLQSGV